MAASTRIFQDLLTNQSSAMLACWREHRAHCQPPARPALACAIGCAEIRCLPPLGPQNLLAVLADPGELPKQPSLGTTEKTWRQHGIQLVRPAAGVGAAAAAGAPGGSAPAAASLAQWQQQHQQQRQAAAAAAASQAAPAPLGLSLLMQQEQQDRQAMPPPPTPAGWAQAPGPRGVQGQAGDGAAGAGQPLAADLVFSPSIEMMPSAGMLPTLSQLLEEPMMTLSLKDDGFVAAAAAAATAAVAAGGPAAEPAPGQHLPLQQQAAPQQGAGAPTAAWPLMPVPGGREESLKLVDELLQPVPAQLGQVLGATGVWPPPMPTQQAGKAAGAAGGPVLAGQPPAAGAKLPAAAVPAELLGMPTPPVSPGSSGEHAHSSGSGSLSYRRVSFTTLHSAPRAGAEEASHTATSRPQPAGAMPFLARPPAVTTAAAPFLAQPPAAAAPPAAFPARPPATLAAAPDAPSSAPASQATAALPPRLAVVQAGGGVRIAQSAAAPVPPPPEEEEKNANSTTATAEGPVTYVSVHDAPSHDFSQGGPRGRLLGSSWVYWGPAAPQLAAPKLLCSSVTRLNCIADA